MRKHKNKSKKFSWCLLNQTKIKRVINHGSRREKESRVQLKLSEFFLEFTRTGVEKDENTPDLKIWLTNEQRVIFSFSRQGYKSRNPSHGC